MAGLRAVEAALFGYRHMVVHAEGVKHGGPHAARGCGARDDDAVGAEQREIGSQIGAEEAGGLLLQDNDVLRRRRNLRHDFVAIHIGGGHHGALATARILPAPGPRVPIVVSAHAGGVDDRQPLLVAFVDQRANGRHRWPALLAAGVAPALDGFKNWLGLVATKGVVDVDDEKGGALAKTATGAIAGGCEDGLVAFGEELVPDGLGHGMLLGVSGTQFVLAPFTNCMSMMSP